MQYYTQLKFIGICMHFEVRDTQLLYKAYNPLVLILQ